MELILKSLHMVNFKGARDEFYEFEKESNVFGDNATGKTTIPDAYVWLLFDKDTTDRKDFEIIPLDSRGQFIKKINTEVEAVFIIDGTLTTIKKTLRQRWEKMRSEKGPTFKGTETVCEWDGVPMKVTEYRAKVSGIIAENIFKLITNTDYFSSLKWQDQRNTLMAIAGTISDSEIAEGDSDFEDFLKDLGKNTMEEWKRKKSLEKKRIKDELDLIPTRIDEANRSLLNLPTADEFDLFQAEIYSKKGDLQDVESGLNSEVEAAKTQNQIILNKQQEIHNLMSEIATIEHDIRSSVKQGKLDREAQISAKTKQVANLQKELDVYNASIESKKKRIESETAELTKLRNEWTVINSEKYQAPPPLVFDVKDFCCPTCKRAYESNDVETKKSEMVANFNDRNEKNEADFNATKSRKLEVNKSRGIELKKSIEILNGDISDLKDEIKISEECLADIKSELGPLVLANKSATENESTSVLTEIANSSVISEKKNKIESLKLECVVPPNKTVEELKEKKESLSKEIAELNQKLAGKEQIKTTKIRIAQLEEQEKKMAAEVSELEGKEFIAERFVKAQMTELETRVNGRFSLVKFQMFETQVNGAEIECCKTLINTNGSFVPITDANNAARINAGLDIIQTLSRHYGILAPIFIDNRESVSEIIKMDNQIINLIVSRNHKKLHFEYGKATTPVHGMGKHEIAV